MWTKTPQQRTDQVGHKTANDKEKIEVNNFGLKENIIMNKILSAFHFKMPGRYWRYVQSVFNFTPTQMNVLRLNHLGTSASIGQFLDISASAVRGRMSRAFKSMGVSNLVEMALRFADVISKKFPKDVPKNRE